MPAFGQGAASPKPKVPETDASSKLGSKSATTLNSKASKSSKKKKKEKKEKKEKGEKEEKEENDEKDGDALSQSASSTKKSKGGKSKTKGKKGKKKGSGGSSKVAPAEDGEELTAGSGLSGLNFAEASEMTLEDGGPDDFSGGGKAGDRRAILSAQEEEDCNHYAMYRPLKGHDKNYQLPVLIKYFNKSYPWPPKSNCFLSSGYYDDLVGAPDLGEIRNKELKIVNINPEVTEPDLQHKFHGAKKIIINPDDTAIIVTTSETAAKKMYQESPLVKLGKRHLAWLRPDELYVIDVPMKLTEKDFKEHFPDSVEIKIQNVRADDGNDRTQVVTVRYPIHHAMKKGLKHSPFPSVGKHQVKYQAKDQGDQPK